MFADFPPLNPLVCGCSRSQKHLLWHMQEKSIRHTLFCFSTVLHSHIFGKPRTALTKSYRQCDHGQCYAGWPDAYTVGRGALGAFEVMKYHLSHNNCHCRYVQSEKLKLTEMKSLVLKTTPIKNKTRPSQELSHTDTLMTGCWRIRE